MKTFTSEQFTSEELVNLTSSQLLKEMEKLRSLAADLGCEWAVKQKAYDDLKELLPHRLAVLKEGYLDSGNYNSTEAKIKAEASPLYQGWINEINAARFELNKALAEYKGVMASLKVLESIGYVRNSEMRLAR